MNPRMLKWARESANISEEVAGKRVAQPAAVIVDWETDRTKPTIGQLRELSRLYKRPLAAFYLPEPPRQQFTVAHDYRRLPDQAVLEFSTALLFAIRMAAYRREIALVLDPDASQSPLFAIGSPQLSPAALGRDARRLLDVGLDQQRAWGDSYAALNGWKNAVEELGVLVFHFSGVAVDEVRGFSIGEPVLPVVALNGGDAVNPRIFTLIHELGHILLGEGGTCDLAELTARGGPSIPVEVFCNAFAGEVLVPAEALLAEPHVREATVETKWSDEVLAGLSRRFRVSREVVLRRLLTLGKANEEHYREWRDEFLTFEERDDKSSGRPPVAVMAVRDVGKPFARLVLDAYRTQEITGSDVSEYLGVRIKHLRAIEARLAGPDLLTGGER